MKMRVLLVDDDIDHLEIVAREFRDDNQIDLVTASTIEDGLQKACGGFYHVFIVDYDLGVRPTGDALLDRLMKVRPTAKRIICTAKAGDHWRALLKLCHPERFDVEAIWFPGGSDVVGQFIRRYVGKIRSGGEIRIGTIEAAYESMRDNIVIAQRNVEQDKIALTKEEIEFVVSRLFLGSHIHGDSRKHLGIGRLEGIDTIREIAFHAIPRGKSLSSVFRGRPRTQRGDEGILCILKLGPRDEISDEIDAYEKYVRFGRHIYTRVEALSHVLADSIGGICYSFVGGGNMSADPLSLQQVLESGSVEDAVKIIRAEFNPKQKEWYSRDDIEDKSLTQFFADAYTIGFPEIADTVRDYALRFMERQADIGGIVASGEWRSTESSLPPINLPNDKDFKRLNDWYQSYRSCIVHGDMNAENILLVPAESASMKTAEIGGYPHAVIPIDYRFTQRGPIFTDFAALEAAVRCTSAELSTIKTKADYDRLRLVMQPERRLLSKAWTGPSGYGIDRTGHNIARGKKSWVDISFELVQLARANFESESGKAKYVKREYVATCFLFALRLLRVTRVYSPRTEQGRARLMAWMSVLLEYMRSPEARF